MNFIAKLAVPIHLSSWRGRATALRKLAAFFVFLVSGSSPAWSANCTDFFTKHLDSEKFECTGVVYGTWGFSGTAGVVIDRTFSTPPISGVAGWCSSEGGNFSLGSPAYRSNTDGVAVEVSWIPTTCTSCTPSEYCVNGNASVGVTGNRGDECPSGYISGGDSGFSIASFPGSSELLFCVRPRAPKCPMVGNPTAVSSGMKVHSESLFAFGGEMLDVTFEAFLATGATSNSITAGFGSRWRDRFGKRLTVFNSPTRTMASVETSIGETERFLLSGSGQWGQIAAISHGYYLAYEIGEGGATIGYRLTTPESAHEIFDLAGQLSL